ncbi:DUF998 domain-containing protein [Actinoplanes sp. NBRC 101535]|uniref:DUF998 domain-containing protein n=1 Tax=Actinoplanes sp. NBRC 101535 TaxID=3032196 RepID=UPI0024A35DEC|nr:DUF998 domain-containing protein [Actinoplanes sp. NBRC 101535]GLY07619.1 hypothetical protein Acsp01_79980 [Actinoplanes sp. NBRC 101535]
MTTRIRLTAVAAACAVAGGAGTMMFTLAAGPEPWWQGYVSESGTAGQPYALPYRWGLITLALGVASLSATWAAAPGRSAPPAEMRLRLTRIPYARKWLLDGTATVWALAVAAVLAAVSGAVPCSHECPLPPYEPTTVADVVHAAASVVGMVVLAAAMATMWLSAADRAVRWLAGTAVLLMVPLGALLAGTMLIVGRAPVGAVVERLVLLIAVAWLIGVALLITRTAGENVNADRCSAARTRSPKSSSGGRRAADIP